MCKDLPLSLRPSYYNMLVWNVVETSSSTWCDHVIIHVPKQDSLPQKRLRFANRRRKPEPVYRASRKEAMLYDTWQFSKGKESINLPVEVNPTFFIAELSRLRLVGPLLFGLSLWGCVGWCLAYPAIIKSQVLPDAHWTISPIFDRKCQSSNDIYRGTRTSLDSWRFQSEIQTPTKALNLKTDRDTACMYTIGGYKYDTLMLITRSRRYVQQVVD